MVALKLTCINEQIDIKLIYDKILDSNFYTEFLSMTIGKTMSQKLHKTSGILFFLAFMLSTLQYIPNFYIAGIFRMIPLLAYLVAYGVWFASNLLLKGHEKKPHAWYGFAQIQKQYLFSSIAGMAATILSIVGLFVPICFPIATAVFFLANALLAIGEYHKLNNPPNEKDFSYTKQKSLVYLTGITALISLVTCVSATLIFIFPTIAIPLTIFSLLISIGLGLWALEYRLDSIFGKHQLGKEPREHPFESYIIMNKQLKQYNPFLTCYNTKQLAKESSSTKLFEFDLDQTINSDNNNEIDTTFSFNSSI